MKSKTKAYEIVKPKNQLFLHGYEKYFKSFIKLVDKNELPSVILLTGHKGIGKSTFAYHFINFIFSKNEENTYSLNEYKINSNNRSYNLLAENIHPNFFLLESDQDKETIKRLIVLGSYQLTAVASIPTNYPAHFQLISSCFSTEFVTLKPRSS